MLDMEVVGKRVLAARKNAGILQKELGDMIGVSQSAIPDIEAGKRKSIKVDTLNAIATATNTPVSTLLGLDVRTLALETIREATPELAVQIEREGVAGLTDKDVRAVVRLILE